MFRPKDPSNVSAIPADIPYIGIRLEGGIVMNLLQKVQRFLVSEDGPTAVEYAVMLALIIIVCLAGVTALGTATNATFTNVSGRIPTGAAS
jgi:pilus assembly protein Flp/PilA